jgi:hypothetical protein
MPYQNNIKYCYEEHEAKEYNLMPFSVSWFHIPTKEKGIRTIYAESKEKMLVLVNLWNDATTWKYHLE